MNDELKILPTSLLEEYSKEVNLNLQKHFDVLHDAELSTGTFSFYTSVSSVFSSKIEGENIELDSYVKHKRFGIPFQPDHTKEIDDLYNAYTSTLAKHIVTAQWQGKHRRQNMYATTAEGRIEYVATSPDQVEGEMAKLYEI